MFKKEKDRLAQLEIEVNQLRHKLRMVDEPDNNHSFHRNGYYYVTGELFINDKEIMVEDLEKNVLIKRALPEGFTLSRGIRINNLVIGWRIGFGEIE